MSFCQVMVRNVLVKIKSFLASEYAVESNEIKLAAHREGFGENWQFDFVSGCQEVI